MSPGGAVSPFAEPPAALVVAVVHGVGSAEAIEVPGDAEGGVDDTVVPACLDVLDDEHAVNETNARINTAPERCTSLRVDIPTTVPSGARRTRLMVSGPRRISLSLHVHLGTMPDSWPFFS
jgi:hypothetical protein